MKTLRVLLLCRYSRLGASSRLRMLQYLPAMQAEGIDVVTRSLFDDGYLTDLHDAGRRSALRIARCYLRRLLVLCTAWRYDLIWIEKELFPFLPALAERLLTWLGKPFVVDYDDATFHSYDLSPRWLVRAMLGRKIDAVMRLSTCVVAGNAYLAERARAAGATVVRQIPTVVDHTRYQPRQATAASSLTIGWIGSPSTQKYIAEARDALREACARHGASLLLVGANADVREALPGIPVELQPWHEDSETRLIRRMDIGIMPLPEGPWENGKCGYKLIQYMACAIPVIGAAVGANIDIIREGRCGHLAGNHAEWLAALDSLLTSQPERERCGAAGRQAVTERYSVQAQAPALIDTLRTAARRPR